MCEVRNSGDVRNDIMKVIPEDQKKLVYELLVEYRQLLKEEMFTDLDKQIDTFKLFSKMRN